MPPGNRNWQFRSLLGIPRGLLEGKRMIRRGVRRRSSEAKRGYQARHKAMGLCIVCPRSVAQGSANYCGWHQEMDRQRKRRLRGPVLCRKCRRPVEESKPGSRRQYHLQCFRSAQAERQLHYRRLHASAARAYQLRHKAQGLCVQCPQPVVPGRLVCERHLRYRQERYRWSKAMSGPDKRDRGVSSAAG